jgi:hypothetical protein
LKHRDIHSSQNSSQSKSHSYTQFLKANMPSYQERIISKANYMLAKCGNNPHKNPHHGIYTGYLKDAPEYPFSITENHGGSTAKGYSLTLTIKTGKRNNLPGIQIIQTYLERRIGHKPSIDELGEFISLFTLRHQRKTTLLSYSTPSKSSINKEELKKIVANANLVAQQALTDVNMKVEEALAAAQKVKDDNTMDADGCQADDDDDWESLCD